MEPAAQSGVDQSPSSRDQYSPSTQERAHTLNSHERLHDPTASITYERLHPLVPDLVLPATFLAITLLGIVFVFVILLIWLRTHLSSRKEYERGAQVATATPKEVQVLHMMEPRENTSQFKMLVDAAVDEPVEERTKNDEVDDFKFSILNDSTDFKYIDELDGARNMSPTLLKIGNNGGSSPKLPDTSDKSEDSKCNDSSGNSTPSSSQAKSRTTEDKFVFPEEGTSKSKASSDKFGKFKVALSSEQQWIMHRKPPLDWRGYNINVPKVFSFTEMESLNDRGCGEGTSKKFSLTRSPSLEKDDRTPPCHPVVDVGGSPSSPVVEVRVQPLTTDSHCAVFDNKPDKNSPKNSTERGSYARKFGALNSGLRICTKNENINPSHSMEKIEMQNSPRLMDSVVDKENNPSPRFCFSPKFFSTNECKSPKFFSTPEQRSPKYFQDNQSKNSSPKVLGAEKPSSPRFKYFDAHQKTTSPLIVDNGNQYRFNFDSDTLKTCTEDSINENNNKVDNLSKDKNDTDILIHDAKTDLSTLKIDPDQCYSYRQNLDSNVNMNLVSDLKHNPDDNHENVIQFNTDKTDRLSNVNNDIIISHNPMPDFIDNKSKCCKESSHQGAENRENLSVSNPAGNTVNFRRQRLKSISLDSDNAKFIEQNLGVPIVKHLKQDNLYDDQEAESSTDNYNNVCSSPPVNNRGRTYFNFNVENSGNFNIYVRPEEAFKVYDHPVINISQPECLITFTDTCDSPDKPTIEFSEVQPRFSPNKFDSPTCDENPSTPKGNKNKRNLTIDLNKRDLDLEKELSDYDSLDSEAEKRVTPKTPTLKVKATSLDSSETLNLSLPQNNTLQVPQNSISVPNTPKRQFKRALNQKVGKLVKTSHYIAAGNYGNNLTEIIPRICADSQQARKFYMNVKCSSNFIDSGIFLKENHANLMLYQASKCPINRGITTNPNSFSRRMGSFDENMVDNIEKCNILSQVSENRLTISQKSDSNMLGSNLLGFKQNLSVSSTNLKTLPEGVPSNDFDIQPNEEKTTKKTLLQRRGSNQSLTINLENSTSNLKYSTLSLQSSNLSLASFGASNHNLASIKNSASNFSLNTDNRQRRNILERRNSNTSLTLNLDYAQGPRLYSSSHCNLQSSQHSLTNQDTHNNPNTKKCLLQRRGSNTSLTLNLQGSASNLNRCTSNSSLNIHNETKTNQKKGLLERRTSNTSLSLNINNSNPQFDNNRVLSVSNYNLDGAGGSGLSRYNSNQSINNTGESKKGLLERRSSNTSLTLNINSSNFNVQGSDVPRDIEIDDTVLQNNLTSYNTSDVQNSHQKDKHRKSLSTENLFSKSYKSKMLQCKNNENVYSFGSHDNLWSNCTSDSFENIGSIGQNLTYVCGDQENEMIYAFGDRGHLENAGFENINIIKNITTKPLSPHSTSEDFKLYLANIQHLQNASNVLTRQQLKDLNLVFKDGYSKSECPLIKSSDEKSPMNSLSFQIAHLSFTKNSGGDENAEGEYNPQRLLPEPVLPSTEYQKSLLRNLHQEFWDLPTNFQEKPMVFGSHPKNRYKTILPNEHSRVILRAEPGENDEGYINANYIKGHEFAKNSYIATQGPLQNTIFDFWLMVYQNGCQFHRDGCTKTNEERHFGSPQAKPKYPQEYTSKKFTNNQSKNIQKIVMLTNLLENGRQKCEKYFPANLNEEMTFKRVNNSSYSSCGSGTFFPDTEFCVESNKVECNEDFNTFTIKNVGIIRKAGYIIRKLYVEYRNKYLNDSSMSAKSDCGEKIEKPKVSIIKPEEDDLKSDHLVVYHYWFDNWADHKCPKDVTALLDLSLDVLQSRLIEFEDIVSERKLSAFQSAKAFFDEFSRLNAREDLVTKTAPKRKNSLASRLDLPKPKQDILRRESTGGIDSSKITGAKALFLEGRTAARKSSLDAKETGKSDPVEIPPIIVHCSAGIGRTGCLIAILNGIKQLKADEKVDILGIVCNMRLNRGGMVQNSEQYELIHKVLCLYEDVGLPDFH